MNFVRKKRVVKRRVITRTSATPVLKRGAHEDHPYRNRTPHCRQIGLACHATPGVVQLRLSGTDQHPRPHRTDRADARGRVRNRMAPAFHVIPLSHHTIHLVEVDEGTRTLRSHEHGGMLRTWNHTPHVEPVSDVTCRYSDTVEIDAGRLPAVVASFSRGIYRYRQRRWHKLVHKHLLPTGPQYASKV